MIKILKFFSLVGVVAFGLSLFSCSTDDDSSGGSSGSSLPPVESAEPADGYIRINMSGSGSFYLWAWKDVDTSVTEQCVSFSQGGVPFDHKNGKFSCVDIKVADNPRIVGLIVKNYAGSKKYTGDSDVMFYFPNKYKQVYFKSGSGTIYINPEMTAEPIGTSAATISANNVIKLNCNGVNLSASTVKLTDKNNQAIAVSKYSNDDKSITLTSGLKTTFASISPITIEVTDTENGKDTLTVGLSSNLVESWYGKTAVSSVSVTKDLGVTINGTTASFKTWAPIASSVKLLLFKDAKKLSAPDTDPIDMVMDKNGFWTVADVDISAYKYYKYRIINNDVEKDVSDIWAYVASGDSEASELVSIDDASTKPEDWEEDYYNPWTGSKYNDAVIFEMHIRDWSRAYNKDSTGKFNDITNALNSNANGFAAHLKDLGITHVQILPMFDYAETNDDSNYNWGYNPYHYNVPEGRYVEYNSDKDGASAVLQMRKMIKAFHDAGIAVNMDVVYNHTSGTGNGSLYDMTVPEYFYRHDENGNLSNGSGCGNEVATNNKMVSFYVVESLKHWMKDYHINGFRFDLMGCQEQSTMQSIYTALYEIDPKVMVYGEPWTGGTSQVKSGSTGAINSTVGNGIGAFDDDFRDAIKGKEFGGFGTGHVQGTYQDKGIVNGLKGLSGSNERNMTSKTGLALHYVECHDNYTLFDKLAISYLGKSSYSGNLFDAVKAAGLAKIKKQEKLAAAYIFLSQGTPFINGGQEFLRTKQGNENSYSSSDTINQIDMTMKTTYADVYNTYKALIAIRKSSDAFTAAKTVDATTVSTGVTKYTAEGTDGKYIVFFNATDSDVACSESGKKITINETDGSYTIATASAAVGSVPAKSFVILKK